MLTQDIKYIIDMDGFNINKEFRPKEVAIMNIITREITIYYFQVKDDIKILSEKDKKSIWYVTKLLHGLPYEDKQDYHPPSALPEIILQHQRDDPGKWAHKGGTCEKNILQQLQLNSVDLERYGCPKMEVIEEYSTIPQEVNTLCNRHQPLKAKSKIAHCSAEEVYLFYRWLIENC